MKTNSDRLKNSLPPILMFSFIHNQLKNLCLRNSVDKI